MSIHRLRFLTVAFWAGLCAVWLMGTSPSALAQGQPLVFGVGMFQPDREKNDATYRPLGQHLAAPPTPSRRATTPAMP